MMKKLTAEITETTEKEKKEILTAEDDEIAEEELTTD